MLTIVLGSLVGPIVGALADGAVRNQEFLESMLVRDFANLTAAAPAIVALALLARTRIERPTSAVYLAWSSIVVAATFGAFRLVMQASLGIVSWETESSLLLPELGRVPVLAVALYVIRWLVIQRERLVQAQRILALEAQRAMDDSHEALRSRVFDHLHGTVTSELVVARVRLNDAAEDVGDPAVRRRLMDVSEHIRRIHELEVRQLAHTMVASGLESSLDEALHGLASSCEGLCDVHIAIDDAYDDLDHALDSDFRARLRLSCYRIVEECLSNALQHGPARKVDISVSTQNRGNAGAVVITVRSDGHAPVGRVRPGVGLNVMQARAASHDGFVTTMIDDGHFVVSALLRVR